MLNYKNIEDDTLKELLKLIGNGKYEITKRIAVGGHGKVLQAKVIGENKKVALKTISLSSPEDEESYKNEVHFLTTLQSKNIVRLLDHYVIELEEEKIGVLVLKKMKMDLMDYFMKFPLTLKERKKIFCKLCKIVRYCHKRGVYHLDLKPDNFLVNYKILDGKPSISSIKLCDFGSAFDVNNHDELPAVFGTLNYRAPEALSDVNDNLHIGDEFEMVPEKLDAWSMGVILFILITGVYPFCVRGNSLHCVGLETVREFAGVQSFHLLKKMCHPNPAERPSMKKLLSNPWLISEEDDEFSSLLSFPEAQNNNSEPDNDHVRDHSLGYSLNSFLHKLRQKFRALVP